MKVDIYTATANVVDRLRDLVVYCGPEDEVGYKACCGAVSYKVCLEGCPIVVYDEACNNTSFQID